MCADSTLYYYCDSRLIVVITEIQRSIWEMNAERWADRRELQEWSDRGRSPPSHHIKSPPTNCTPVLPPEEVPSCWEAEVFFQHLSGPPTLLTVNSSWQWNPHTPLLNPFQQKPGLISRPFAAHFETTLQKKCARRQGRLENLNLWRWRTFQGKEQKKSCSFQSALLQLRETLSGIAGSSINDLAGHGFPPQSLVL